MSTERVESEVAATLAGSDPIGLYVHIPFCQSLCAYCGCNVIPTRDKSRAHAYVDHLVTEMTLLARNAPTAPVTEIALGGGSPNFLSPILLWTLGGAIERFFNVTSDARKSIELDPRTTMSAHLETLGKLGFRSISLGVQDFAEPVQDAIRRHQSVAQTRWLVEQARAHGANDINIDMVYGLPLQTESSFAKTLDSVIELSPDRVAVFGYAHLPDKLPHQRIVERAGRLPDAHERAALLVLAIERFTQAGYVHVGLDHFARPGSAFEAAAREHRLVRTFQGYVERRADSILGLGTSAISSTPRMFWQNHTKLANWESDITSLRLPVARGIVLDRDDRVRRALIDHLMCDGEVALDRISDLAGVDTEDYFARELDELKEMRDLVIYDASRHRVQATPLGRLLVRNICMVFDRYRPDRESTRFSSTV